MKLAVFRENIVRFSLEQINEWCEASERLVIATALAESELKAVRQRGGGPALGFWQMEPATHDDIFANYLGATKRQLLLDGLCALSDRPGDARELEVNPFYGAALCRIHYLRVRAPLPHKNDFEAMARYWKQHYNTHLGAGTVRGFLAKADRAMRL